MFNVGDLILCQKSDPETNYEAEVSKGVTYQVISHPENSNEKVWIKGLMSTSSQYVRPSNFTLVGTSVKNTGAMKVPKTKRGVSKKGYMPIYASSLGKISRLVGGFVFKTEEEASASVQKHASLVNIVAVEILVPPMEDRSVEVKAATTLL